LQGTKLEVEPPSYCDLSHDHRRKSVSAHLALGGKPFRLDGNIVSAVLQRRDLGIVPLIAKPLSIRESVSFGPVHKVPDRLDYTVALVGLVHSDVRHGARGEVADFDPEGVWIVPRPQAIDVRELGGLLDGRLELIAASLAPGPDVEGARGTPNRCLKHREKSDDEEKPHPNAIVVSDRERVRDMSVSAFSRRSRFTKSAGVDPTRAWKTRWKWNGESIATRDRSRSRSGSSRCPTMWSMARLTLCTYVAVVAG
jgi:hypothetical protein